MKDYYQNKREALTDMGVFNVSELYNALRMDGLYGKVTLHAFLSTSGKYGNVKEATRENINRIINDRVENQTNDN